MNSASKTRVVAPVGAGATGRESLDRRDSSLMLPRVGLRVCGFLPVLLAVRGLPSRPASMTDLIVDRGEYVGDGVPRTAAGLAYEPLTWGALKRI